MSVDFKSVVDSIKGYEEWVGFVVANDRSLTAFDCINCNEELLCLKPETPSEFYNKDVFCPYCHTHNLCKIYASGHVVQMKP